MSLTDFPGGLYLCSHGILPSTSNSIEAKDGIMGLTEKCTVRDEQLNVKVSAEIFNRYKLLRDEAVKQGYEFSLQPEFSDWLNGYLVTCEKKLAAAVKDKVKQAQVLSAGGGA